MTYAWRILGALLLLAIGMAGPAMAERRIALIIGNSAYRNAPALKNPAMDAAAVAQTLGRLGFETTLATDLTKGGMDDAFRSYARTARGADVALFYYAGHAMQYEGQNYLMPVDAKLADEVDVRYEMSPIDEVFAAIKSVQGVRIVILDACRDNPLADALLKSLNKSRSAVVPRGLARIEQRSGTIVAYATQAGATADDGQGTHSPFAAAFLDNAETPGLEIGQMFRRVARAVNTATNGAQTPELSVSLLGEFYMKAGDPASAGVAAAAGSVLLLEVDQDRLEALRLGEAAERVREVLARDKIAIAALDQATGEMRLRLADARDASKAAEAIRKEFAAASGGCQPAISTGEPGTVRIAFETTCLGAPSADLVSDVAVALTRRLTQLRREGIGVRVLGGSKIEISYAGLDRDPAQVAALLGSGALSFRLVDPNTADAADKTPPDGEVLLRGYGADEKTYLVSRQPIVTGVHLLDAQASVTSWGEPVITLTLDTVGADAFGKATTAQVGHAIAIVFDDRVLSAPVVREPILGGQLQISGDMTAESAKTIAAILRSGQLPAPMKIADK